MKYTACQLVQGGVIRGVIHHIGGLDPISPLCDRSQIRLCERTKIEFLPTEAAANCRHCALVTHTTPLVIEHTPTPAWAGIIV